MKSSKERLLVRSTQGFRVTRAPTRSPFGSLSNIKKVESRVVTAQKNFRLPISQIPVSLSVQNNTMIDITNQHIEQTSKDSKNATILRLLNMIMTRGRKVKQLVAQRGQKMITWILQSQSIKITMQNILEKLIQQRRINIDLKGLNNTMVSQIQKSLLTTLTSQVSLYQKQTEFEQMKKQISTSLSNYKKDLMKQLQTIRTNKTNST